MASQFVSSIVQCIRALCHECVQFSSSIEVVGHIYLNVDKESKFNYIVNEEVNKNPRNLTTVFHTNSYHSQPPAKQILAKENCHWQPNVDLVSGMHDVRNMALSADLTSSALLSVDKRVSVIHPVDFVVKDRDQTDKAVQLHNRHLEEHCDHTQSPVSSPRPFLERSSNSPQHKCVSSPLNPVIVVKEEPDTPSPHSCISIRDVSDGK